MKWLCRFVEIGVNLRSEYMIKYDFDGTYKSTIAEKIRVAFTTTDQKGMLVGLSSYTGEYLNLMMSNSGEIYIYIYINLSFVNAYKKFDETII